MGILTAILAFLSIICMGLSIVTIIQLSTEPIFNANLTWPFWMSLAVFFMLGAIAVILYGRGRNS